MSREFPYQTHETRNQSVGGRRKKSKEIKRILRHFPIQNKRNAEVQEEKRGSNLKFITYRESNRFKKGNSNKEFKHANSWNTNTFRIRFPYNLARTLNSVSLSLVLFLFRFLEYQITLYLLKI